MICLLHCLLFPSSALTASSHPTLPEIPLVLWMRALRISIQRCVKYNPQIKQLGVQRYSSWLWDNKGTCKVGGFHFNPYVHYMKCCVCTLKPVPSNFTCTLTMQVSLNIFNYCAQCHSNTVHNVIVHNTRVYMPGLLLCASCYTVLPWSCTPP